jgi:hypothetical protein
MAFPTDTFTGVSGDLAVLIPSVWGEKINDYFKEELVMGDFFVNRSDELAGGASTLHTPDLTAMAANTKTNGAAVTLNSPTETKVDLVVTTWKEVSFAIEDREAAIVKRSYNIQNRYAENAGFEIARELETAIAALFSGFSQTVGASSTNLADSDIRQAIAILEISKVPGMYRGDVAFFLHPNTFWRQVQNIDKFSLAINSPVNDPTAKKPAATLYGIPVYVSPNVPAMAGGLTTGNGRRNLLAHRDAIHWAAQPLGVMSKGGMVGSQGIRVQSNYVPEYLATLTTADICYGVVKNRDNAGVQLLSHNSAA